MKQCPNLKEVALYDNVLIGNDLLELFSKHSFRLQTLVIAGCRRVNAEGIGFVLQCPKLKVLEASGCYLLENEMIQQIEKDSSIAKESLERLVLCDCKFLGQQFALACLREFKSLLYLNLEVGADGQVALQPQDRRDALRKISENSTVLIRY